MGLNKFLLYTKNIKNLIMLLFYLSFNDLFDIPRKQANSFIHKVILISILFFISSRFCIVYPHSGGPTGLSNFFAQFCAKISNRLLNY